MSKIVSIGTAVPQYRHRQEDILDFMTRVYAPDEAGRRKLKFLYRQGGIESRYSVIPDYSLPASSWQFYIPTEDLEPFPTLENRMEWFNRTAAPLSKIAVDDCLCDIDKQKITHLVTVSCTGLSAPGLDLQLMQLLGLSSNISRVAVNFMGCYAAIHALKLADAFCKSDRNANVLIVCTELCTLHFQKECTVDNITSSMLFADGAAAVLVNNDPGDGLDISRFHAQVAFDGGRDMAWELSSSGFRMTLSSYVADLVEENFGQLVSEALESAELTKNDISHWCIHPGGKKILEAVHNSLGFLNGQLDVCYEILRQYGNMSSPTILFILRELMKKMEMTKKESVLVAAFGPGLTMETVILNA